MFRDSVISRMRLIFSSLARAEMTYLLATVYSQFSTVASERMAADGISMEMSDQLLTVRPRDTQCWLKFVATE